MEVNRVRRIIFTFDNREEFRYDVNQTIKIIDLKKILETGLQIPRFKIRLYHDAVEYTNLDESKIEVLFPTQKEIIFLVSFHPLYSNEKSEKEIAIKLRLGFFCKLHENKYPCHFCFDCNESFCSICHKNQTHADHETIEKYDYLQDAELIVERIFKKLTTEVLSLRFENQEQVQILEHKIKGNYFDILRNLLAKIEERARDLLKMYSEVNIRSLREIDQNLKKVKKNCIDALCNKKEELQMQNIIIDESIVVSYYNTILQIHNQKEPVYNDIQRYLESLKSFKHVNKFLENVSKELNKVLEGFLNNNEEYTVCEKEIRKNEIKPVDEEEVKTTLYRDILNSTSKKPLSHGKFFSDSPFNTESKGVTKFHHMDEGFNANNPVSNIDFGSNKKAEGAITLNLKQELVSNNISKKELEALKNVQNEYKDNQFNEPKASNLNENKMLLNGERERYISNNISTCYSSSQVISNLKPSEKNLTYSHQPFKVSYSETTLKDLNMDVSQMLDRNSTENVIYNIIPNTRNLMAYNESTNKMKVMEIKFPLVSSVGCFLENSSFLNINGKLYVSGGSYSTTPGPSSQFLLYDQSSGSLKILADLNEPRQNHSMIHHNNNIYIVGGESTRSMEIYDLENKTLKAREYTSYEAVDNPILYVHKNFLYSFFGKKNGKFVDFVQRVNLNIANLKWEKVPYKLENKNLNIKLTNSATIPFGDNEIFFFGGKTERGITREVISFDFENKEFKLTDIVLDEAHYFNNSQFNKISSNVYSSFSSNEKENLIKVTVDLDSNL